MLNLAREKLLASTIISGFAATFVAAGVAVAQAPAPTPAPAAPAPAAKEAAASEEVVVTGTRVKRPGITSASPITTVGVQEMKLQQTPEVEKLIRNLPASIPGDNPAVNNGTSGAATVNLRGVGTQRTLVMLDGKRMVPFDINGVADIATVPLAMVDRVDVITGGASAVYGSDAIAGAVNFVLKKDFEGVAINTSFSTTDKGDGNTWDASAVIGANLGDGRGNVTLGVNYTSRQAILLGQRDFGRVEVASGTGNGLSGVLTPAPIANCGGPNVFGGIGGADGGSSATIPTRIGLRSPAGALQFREDGTLSANCSRFNFNPYNYYQTPQERYSFMATAHYQINDNVEAYARAMFSNTVVRQQIAPSGLFTDPFNIPLANPFLSAQARAEIINRYNAALIAGTRTMATLQVQDLNANGVVDIADTINVTLARRTVELGPRSTTYDSSAYQVLIGLRGDFGASWHWDISYQHGSTTKSNISAGYSNKSAIQLALMATNPNTCLGGGSCVPIDLFHGAGSITPAMADFARATALLKSTYQQDIISANVNGELAAVVSPWAETPLQLAFGMEYRQERGEQTPDECLKLFPTSCLGGAGGPTLPAKSAFDVYEMYAEAIMPIIENMPGAKKLQIEAAYRYSEYNPAGQNSTWKVGLTWEPMDGLRLRVMKQRAVRAPAVGELLPPSIGLVNGDGDPCSDGNTNAGGQSLIDTALRLRCIANGVPAFQFTPSVGRPGFFDSAASDIIAGQINVTVGTDPNNLPRPEVADTLTAGVVWQPDFFGSSIVNPVISLDYYKINITDVIDSYAAQEVLNACLVDNLAAFCPLIRRDSQGSLTEAGASVFTLTTNTPYRKAEGIELGVSFGVDLDEAFGTTDAGKLNFAFNGNMYLKNEYQTHPLFAAIDCLGHYGNNCGNPRPEYRWTLRTTYETGDWTISALWRHLGEATAEPGLAAGIFPAFRRIRPYDYLDLAVSWQAMEEVGITLSANNVLNQNPPIVGNQSGTTSSNSGNTFPSVYDTYGTVYTLGFNLRF